MGRPRRFGVWLVALVLASGLPLIALSVALVTTSALGQRQQVLDGLESTASGLQRAIDAELRIWVASLQTLAASPALDAVLAAGPDGTAARAAFHAEASDLVARGGGAVVNAVLFAVPDGRQIVNTFVPPGAPLPTVAAVEPPPARAKAGPPLDPTRAFAEVTARGTPYVSDLLVGPVTRRLLVTVAVPVLRDGRVVALLTLSVAPDGFNAVLSEGGLTPGAIAAVVDRAGVIVGRSRDAARYVGEFGVDDVRRFQNDPEARTARLRMNTVDGQAVYGVMRRLETAPWSVVYGAPQAAVDAPLRRELVYGGGAGLLALAVFVAAALWQGRRLGREMAALGADAAAVGRGAPMPLRDDRIAEVAEVRAALRSGVAALAEREERLRLATEGTGMATWDLDVRSGVMVWSPLGYRMLGLAERPAVAPTLALWRDRVHPEDLPHLEGALRTAETAGAFHCVYRIRRADDGAERWLETFGRLRDAGPGGRMIGVAFDVTERREAEEQRVLLMREVDHRAKNVLAVVQAVVRLTRADEPAAFARTIEGRVLALARAHELLARDQWQGAGLRELAARELEGPLESGAARIDGPNLQLKPAAVQPMAMVLHELATNAAKHGALSREGGRVDLGWRITDAGRLALRWVERGGPEVAGAPRSVSFGWRMITATVQGQLSGALSADWSPEGLSVTIEIDPSLYAAAGPRAVPGGAAETGASPTAVSDSLRGRRVLVAEDEALIAADVAATLRAAGAVVVGPAATVDEGRALVATAGALDAALLDLDLRGELAIPLAEALDARGVPVVVLSAFDDLERAARWPGGAPVATLRKPAAAEAIVAALVRAVDGRAAARESSRPR